MPENFEMKGFTFHSAIRIIGGLILVALITYGAHHCFELYQKYMMVETAENIDSKNRKEIDKKFPEAVLPNAVKPGYMGPKDGIERYLGEDEKKVSINKILHEKLFFTKALTDPINNELNETFFGWQTNDLLNQYLSFISTDNDENYQLGILDATRHYAKILKEKLSRSKERPEYNNELVKAYDSFSVDETRYIGPSAEYKYNQAIEAVKRYSLNVKKGDADFHITSENLAVLINTSIYLINKCEPLLKTGKGENEISSFQADNNFYFSQGVAKVISPVLKSIERDFSDALTIVGESGNLIKAYERLDLALNMDPFMITEGSLDGVLANHRSNLAIQLSYAKQSLTKFYKSVEKKLIIDEKKEKEKKFSEIKDEKTIEKKSIDEKEVLEKKVD